MGALWSQGSNAKCTRVRSKQGEMICCILSFLLYLLTHTGDLNLQHKQMLTDLVDMVKNRK